MAAKAADLVLGEGWFGIVSCGTQTSNKASSNGPDSSSPKQPNEYSQLSARVAETIYSVIAQALVLIAATAPEVCICPAKKWPKVNSSRLLNPHLDLLSHY